MRRSLIRRQRANRENDTVRKLSARIYSFLLSEEGPTTVEYAIMLTMIVLVCFASIGLLGSSVNMRYNQIATSHALTGPGP